MKRIAIFASGSGSNAENIANYFKNSTEVEIPLILANTPKAYVLERANKFGVPTLVFNPKEFDSKRDFERMIADRLDAERVDLVCLAGYMRIVGEELLSRYGGKIVNIHPALLPAFKGAHAIKDAFEYGVKVYGVTIHDVDSSLDGGRIISQVAVPYEGDDIDFLESMIHKAEHKLYIETINRITK